MLDELIEQLIRKQLRQYDKMMSALPAHKAAQATEARPARHEQCRPSVGRRSNRKQVAVGADEKMPAGNRGRRNALLAKVVSGENLRLPARAQD